MALDIKKIQKDLSLFASDRDWDQFHNPKNLSMALSVEASELVELFQWLSEKESQDLATEKIERVSEELADILLYSFRLADKLNIDLEQSIERKIKINESKYPAELVKGSSKKYSEY